MAKTQVAVIGLGAIAQLIHLPNFSKIKNAELTAVAEVKSSRLKAIADKFNVKERYKEYRELLKNSDADAVVITTPTSLHKEVAIECLKAGKDVLVEKPLARTYPEGKAIVEAASKYKRKLMVGMNLRFRPDLNLLKTLIHSGEIGEPFYVNSSWIRQQSSEGKWFTKREEAGGGVILDLGIHLIYLSLWLLNYPKVTSVSTKNFYHTTKNIEDTSISILRCGDSSIINLEASWSLAVEKDNFLLTVYGSKGSISTNPFKLFKKIGNEYIDLKPGHFESPSQLFKRSYLNELKSFIGAIRGENPLFSSGESALQRLQVIEAMYKSAERNQEIKLI
jgi:predicted dehydrogenase